MNLNKIAVLLMILLIAGGAFAHTEYAHTDSGLLVSSSHEENNYSSETLELPVDVYYNVACGMCAEYLDSELIPILTDIGFKNIQKKDYVNDKSYRKELNERSEALGIPLILQGHFAIFIGDKTILEGHVPVNVIQDVLSSENQKKFDKIIIYQDEMDNPVSYRTWAFKGEIKEFSLKTSVSEYLNWFQENKDSLETPKELQNRFAGSENLLPLILVSGFLDGLNPCAFAVLLFFIAFLFTIQRAKKDILKVGLVYILMIYLAYLGIGLGLMNAIEISGQSHLMAVIGAWLVIILGLINIKDFFWYGKGISLTIPKFSTETIHNLMHKATIPSAIVLGILVGLCTFPCSGGIYVAIIGLLSLQTTFAQGLMYLLIYNFVFVLPLIIVLFAVSNEATAVTLSKYEAKHKRIIKLLFGLLMIALGAIILIWFV